MILKLTTADLLNTSLVDVASSKCIYKFVTALCSDLSDDAFEEPSVSPSGASKVSGSSHDSPDGLDAPPFSPLNEFNFDPPTSEPRERRITQISDGEGEVIAHISWSGRHPEVYIGATKVGGLTELFGSTNVPFMPKALAIPTRFDPNWIWIATSESLILLDNSNETTMGVFHHNAIRIPTALTPGRRKSSHAIPPNHANVTPDTQLLSSDSDSTPSLLSPSVDPSHSSFFQPHIPGIGSNYLEYTPHPLAHNIEIIISSLMIEILRRGRFSLTPYTFNRPKAGQIKEARELMLRRLRRNTV